MRDCRQERGESSHGEGIIDVGMKREGNIKGVIGRIRGEGEGEEGERKVINKEWMKVEGTAMDGKG